MEMHEHRIDFGDGKGETVFYSRRINARESMLLDGYRKRDEHGRLSNQTEFVVQTFLLRAKDAGGQRMFVRPEDQERVWSSFDVDAIAKAVREIHEKDEPAGN
jgi:hypothetical protein